MRAVSCYGDAGSDLSDISCGFLLPPVVYACNASRGAGAGKIGRRSAGCGCGIGSKRCRCRRPAQRRPNAGRLGRVLGLDGAGKNRQRRVLAVMAKLNETGGLSIPYFVRLAEAAGYQIQIDEPQPFRVYVNRAGESLAPRNHMGVALTCAAATTALPDSAAGYLGGGRRADRLQRCRDRKPVQPALKPAHTAIRFTYR